MKLYCDADENGKIIEALMGDSVITSKQMQHVFDIENEIDVTQYNVINGELIFNGEV